MKQWVILAINLIFDLFVVFVVGSILILTGIAIVSKFAKWIDKYM